MNYDKYIINGIRDITIVNFSDLHYTKHTKNKLLNKVYNGIKNIKPDYITFTGDLIDYYEVTFYDNNKKNRLFNFLEQISTIAPVLIGLGNHDLYTNNKINNDFFEKINNINNVHILNNDSYTDRDITIYGYTVPRLYYKNPHIKKIDNIDITYNKYNIILIHNPEIIENNIDLLDKFDLILCGHMHNGLVPHFIKGNWGIISPRKLLFPKYARGYKNINNINIITSGGITKFSIRSKFFHLFNFIYKPQIDIIKIKRH